MAHKILIGLLLVALTLAGAACGDDGGGEGDLEAYCERVKEFDDAEEDDFPSEDELDDLRDDAPEEIRDDIDRLIDFFNDNRDTLEEGDFSAFEEAEDDEELAEAFENVERFEDENCPS